LRSPLDLTDWFVDGGALRAYQLRYLMDILRHRSFRLLCALFAFFMFTGDIIADSFYEATRACAADCQSSGCDTCPACACPTHSGSAAAPEGDATFRHDLATNDSVLIADDRPELGAPPAIDHPPQLA
jgi:hypothetical protein